MRNIPILVEEGGFRIGPLMISIHDGSIRSSPWPDWFSEIVPDSWVDFGDFPWTPGGYTPCGDGGGIWIVSIDSQEESEFFALVLDRKGKLRSKVPLKSGDRFFISEPLVSGDWVFAFGNFFRISAPSPAAVDLDDSAFFAINFDEAAIGDDGGILLPDGRIISPDGTIIQAFETADIVRMVRSELEIHNTDFPDDKVRVIVLGRTVLEAWLLIKFYPVGWENQIQPKTDVIVNLFLSDHMGYRVRRIIPLMGIKGTTHTHFPDGGWLVQVFDFQTSQRKNRKPSERWIFCPPGKSDLRMYSLSGRDERENLSGEMFVHLPELGLLAFLEEKVGMDEYRTLLWLEPGERIIPILPVRVQRFLNVLKDGWFMNNRGDQKPLVIFRYPERVPGFPKSVVFPSDIQQKMKRIISTYTDARQVFVWNGNILVQGYNFSISENRSITVFSTIRLQKGALKHLQSLEVDGVVDRVLWVHAMDMLSVCFQFANPQRKVLVMVDRDGNIIAVETV